MATKRAVVIGSGPNGLSAAITLARAGVAVTVLETNDTIGGAARTEELTLPGFRHDVGSSVYPMGVASPFFRMLPLAEFGLRWVQPEAPLAHAMEGAAVMLERSVEATAEGLDRVDRAAYVRWMRPLVEGWEDLGPELLGPVVHWPKHPLLLGLLGTTAAWPATVMAKTLFRGERARALFAGNAAHGVRPLEGVLSAAVGVVLQAVGHAAGWPVAEGGAGRLTGALAGYLRSLGAVIRTGARVTGVRRVGGELRVSGAGLVEEMVADAVMGDVSPRALVGMAGEGMASGNRRLMERFRYGPGSFKVDWALSEPIPWEDANCLRAATVHVGGTMEEVASSERAPWGKGGGSVLSRPFVLVTQPSVCDGTRAPAGGHTAWGYCHVPNGWEGDATELIEGQVERFAPRFREVVVGRRSMGTQALERWDANLVGGDVGGGAMTPLQMVMRPTPRLYGTSVEGVYLCSSSTPPGGGVHGMCGYLAGLEAAKYLGCGG